jgi:hypothetical protein
MDAERSTTLALLRLASAYVAMSVESYTISGLFQFIQKDEHGVFLPMPQQQQNRLINRDTN